MINIIIIIIIIIITIIIKVKIKTVNWGNRAPPTTFPETVMLDMVMVENDVT